MATLPYFFVAMTGIPGASLVLSPRRDIDRHVSPCCGDHSEIQTPQNPKSARIATGKLSRETYPTGGYPICEIYI
jgi:hypothetical protein